MKRNVGITDRIIRLAVAMVAVALYFADVLNGAAALALLAVFALTAIATVCPLYRLLGISTHKRR